MTPSKLTSQHLRGTAASTLIGAIFALIWGINGSLALPGSWRVVTAAVILVTFGMVTVSVIFYNNVKRFPPSADTQATNPFLTTAYRVAVVGMLIALPVTSRVLTLNGRGDVIMPAVAIIVGLHFLGLVPAFRSSIFAWIAGGFCLVGFVALFLPAQAERTNALELRYAVVGLGCALVLWLGALPLILKTFRQLAEKELR